MAVIEVGREEARELSLRQRWSHYLVIGYGLVMFLIALNMRDSTLYATVPYQDVRAGVRVLYPQNWLLDTSGDYIFRVRDMTSPDFKTTILIQIQPISPVTTARNLLDNLSLSRSQSLSGYRQFPRQEVTLGEDIAATSMAYTFTFSEVDPFLQSVPIPVQGLDIVVIQREQAVIITFQASAERYDELFPYFETFLADLEF